MTSRLNVLLDLDGTLTDSRPGIVACIRHALERLGETGPSDAGMQHFIGPPLRDTFALLLRCELEAQSVTDAIAAYRERFTASGMFENSVYEHIPEALDRLSTQGARLFLATSKPRVFAERILEHFELASRFDAIYGSELDGSLCEKDELIAHVVAHSNLNPRDSVMIGDRRHDILGALRNEVFPAGVLWGYGSRDELVAAGAKLLLEDPTQLPNVLTTSHFEITKDLAR
jgi:phosphoglycolate phosphatase